ncbi:GNAT family N-acetyltransferase [Elusimicrobiota bacterium]
MKIKPVETKKDFKIFLDLPQEIYKDSKNWVPKMDMDSKHLLGDKNPFYKHAWKKLFIAFNDKEEAIGRIAAIIDYNYVDFHDEKTGFFGFFDSIDDKEVSKALFNECEGALLEKGMNNVIGPMNPSSNDECGLLIDGFDLLPRIMMPYNAEYYMELLEAAGYAKAKDLLAFNMVINELDYSRLDKFIGKIKNRNPQLSCRYINLKSFNEEVESIRDIYNNAWEKNWGFVPWTDEELDDMAKQLKPLVVDDLVQIGCWEGKPVGFLLTLPDYNEIIKEIGRRLLPLGWLKFLLKKNKIMNLRLLAMGVNKEFQQKGVGALMYYNALMACRRIGYKECEFSWILEDNYDTIRIADLMGGKVYKKYRIYQKDIAQ